MSSLTVPPTPEDLGLPFEAWRQYQREAVQDLVSQFDGYRVVLLSAPTGSGKTIIGSAIGRVLSGSALFLSHTIRLQQQQLLTLPEAKTATGRGNHPCVLKDPMTDTTVEGLMAAEAPCKCEYVMECPYYCQFFDCAETPEAVLNYAYATRILRAKYIKIEDEGFPNPFRGRDVMVCDEGHLLERALVDAEGVQVSRRAFKSIGIDVPDSRDIEDWVSWADGHVGGVSQILLPAARHALRANPASRSLRSEVRRLRAASEVLTKLSEIDVQDVPWFVGRTEHGYQVRPLWVWDQATPVLFRHSPHVLIMSATLGDPSLLARLLGLKHGEWTHLEVPSTFPVPNRPVYYWPVAKMRHGMPDSEKVRQAQALDRLAALFPSTPGVVHCNSFALGEFLEEHVKETTWSRMMVPRRGDNGGVVRAFEREPKNCILVSPSVTVGVDWDFVGWSMIPKVPYPDLGDDIVRLRFEYVTEEGEPIGKKVYQQDAAVTVVQAAGRHVRTERSKGVTVITDRAFWPLFKYQAPAAFPQWFRDAVVWQEM